MSQFVWVVVGVGAAYLLTKVAAAVKKNKDTPYNQGKGNENNPPNQTPVPNDPTGRSVAFPEQTVMKYQNELEAWLQSEEQHRQIYNNDPKAWQAAAQAFYKKNGYDWNDYLNWTQTAEAIDEIEAWAPQGGAPQPP